MADDQHIITDGNDDRLYERGVTCDHSSDEDSSADVGLSVGLGGAMLYAGEAPAEPGAALVIYPAQGERTVIVSGLDFEAAKEAVSWVATAIARGQGGDHG